MAWACFGSGQSKFDYVFGTDDFEFQRSGSFHGYDGKTSEVMACCDDDYEGCEDVPGLSPVSQNCLKDCAYQMCRKMVVDFKAKIDDLAENNAETMAFLEYLDQHSSECQQALLARTDCESDGPDNSWCEEPNVFWGRWNVDTTNFPTFSDYVFDAECEIWNFDPFPGEQVCDGVQGNNADPFPATPVGIDVMWPFEVTSASGQVEATIDYAQVLGDVEVTDVQFRKQIDCGFTAPCAFRLDQMRLAVEEIDLGPLSLIDIQGALFVTAAGTHTGNTATLPESSLQIFVVGSVESTSYPLLDGLPFAWVLHNNDPMTLYVTESPAATPALFGIDSASLSPGAIFDTAIPYAFSFEVDREEYFAP